MARNTRERIFQTEMLQHYQIVYNFLFRMCGNGADAADLVQETFARAYVKIEQYEPGTNARAWLFRLAQNLFINDYRKRNRRAETELDERAAYNRRDEGHAMAGFSDLRIAGAMDQDFSDPIVKAMTFLKDEQRAIIIMADLYDFSEKDIADATGLNLNTVKSTTRRARIALIRQLATYAADTYGIVNTRNLG
ncbi:sigma-70 family RNA polymerase sigma factor [Neolewinella lacunae]|uniref:Sigma-70 family RNA polymerase sigma factor n=1 Tax=Neolewinella lacunae TaxID=1517758 RepID=A0A923PNK0_9BACT|nr:sigma-70 family RNA polymerase sigma factor [Neolewinella lacunae]MBC6996734.1 sigma-70 family RNA polymerase sigma factor [Neolewinella lacunae]MDN3633401.1 sigma-70 family RNA polymerase sigma factor [Neolewinella lacunae]